MRVPATPRATRITMWQASAGASFVTRDICSASVSPRKSSMTMKKDSPSCGLERVRVHGTGGSPARNGRGLFAEALVARFPSLPVEEEGRLCDARLRESSLRIDTQSEQLLLAAKAVPQASVVAFACRHLQVHAMGVGQPHPHLVRRTDRAVALKLGESHGAGTFPKVR